MQNCFQKTFNKHRVKLGQRSLLKFISISFHLFFLYYIDIWMNRHSPTICVTPILVMGSVTVGVKGLDYRKLRGCTYCGVPGIDIVEGGCHHI